MALRRDDPLHPDTLHHDRALRARMRSILARTLHDLHSIEDEAVKERVRDYRAQNGALERELGKR